MAFDLYAKWGLHHQGYAATAFRAAFTAVIGVISIFA